MPTYSKSKDYVGVYTITGGRTWVFQITTRGIGSIRLSGFKTEEAAAYGRKYFLKKYGDYRRITQPKYDMSSRDGIRKRIDIYVAENMEKQDVPTNRKRKTKVRKRKKTISPKEVTKTTQKNSKRKIKKPEIPTRKIHMNKQAVIRDESSELSEPELDWASSKPPQYNPDEGRGGGYVQY